MPQLITTPGNQEAGALGWVQTLATDPSAGQKIGCIERAATSTQV